MTQAQNGPKNIGPELCTPTEEYMVIEIQEGRTLSCSENHRIQELLWDLKGTKGEQVVGAIVTGYLTGWCDRDLLGDLLNSTAERILKLHL